MILASITPWSLTVSLLTILGSLGVFLYGMKVMSEGVQKVAGEKMRGALAKMTANRLSGVFTGFFITSIVQSSSATTVLVVSFVHAGLLTLVEAIGVIMGANLGTTVTAWIVAMTAKFQVSTIALPLIGIGLPCLFLGKDKGKSWGETLIGFGLVLFGLGLLKDSVPDVRTMMREDPEVARQIEGIMRGFGGHGFGSVILFLLGGIVLTLLVQSSSAAMAITITCALSGWLGDIQTDPLLVFRNSAAIVLGENIGTTVTAWLAALPANTAAKRAARAHFVFNVIGVCWMLVLFHPFTQGVWNLVGSLPESLRAADKSFQKSEIAFATAIFHSAFNFVNICILIWFVPQITRLVERLVKEKPGEATKAHLPYLAGSFVGLGELNLAEAEAATKRMAGLASEMFNGFTEVVEKPGEDLSVMVAGLKKLEETCDSLLQDTTAYLIQCSAHEIGAGNADRVAKLLRAVSEYEEATDRIYRLVKTVQRKYKQGQDFTEGQHRDLRAIAMEVRASLDLAANSLSAVDAALLETAHAVEDRVDALRKRHNAEAARRMQAGGNVQAEMLYIDMNNHLEAVANHTLNIVQTMAPAVKA
jgi:phosphate:Na+ symporter